MTEFGKILFYGKLADTVLDVQIKLQQITLNLEHLRLLLSHTLLSHTLIGVKKKQREASQEQESSSLEIQMQG